MTPPHAGPLPLPPAAAAAAAERARGGGGECWLPGRRGPGRARELEPPSPPRPPPAAFFPSPPPSSRFPVFPVSRFSRFVSRRSAAAGREHPPPLLPPRLQPVWGLRGGLQVQGCSSARPSPGAAVRSPPTPPTVPGWHGWGDTGTAVLWRWHPVLRCRCQREGRLRCRGARPLGTPPPPPGGRRLSPSPLSGASLAFATGGSWRELACPGRRARCWG